MNALDEGTWAVVTGASDGIGRALAIQLGMRGYNVLALGRSATKLEDLQKTYRGLGQMQVHAMDFSAPGSAVEIQRLIANKNVQIFAPAAGFGSSGNFANLDLNSELLMIDVNCRAVVEQTQWFVKKFESQKGGTFIFFSSLLGTTGAGTTAVYAATKNFIHAFSEGLRTELKPFGVKVLTICPGPTNSGFASASDMQFSGADEADAVAEGIVRSIGKNGTVVPASRAKFLSFVLGMVPRRLRVLMTTKSMSASQANH